MDLLRRIATGVCVCAALAGLTTSSALAVKPSLLLVAGEPKKAVAIGGELTVQVRGGVKVTTTTGTSDCQELDLPGRVTANGGLSIQIELQRAEEQGPCDGKGAMPFASSSFLWGWGNFPFTHSFGVIVLKAKGKSTSTGSAELHPSPSTADDIFFSATEGGLARECDYTFKKLKGSWFAGPLAETSLSKGNKLKSSGSENEASCPKKATVAPITLEIRLTGVGPVEVDVV